MAGLPPSPRSFGPALVVLAMAALAAGGCSRTQLSFQEEPSQAQPLEALVAAPQSAAGWTALAPQGALLHLPDARQVARGLRERRPGQGQGFVQEIEISVDGGTGRNLLTIAVHGQAALPTLYPGKPSQDGIRTEITAAFPGKTFRVVAEPRRNAFGPYGLALFAGRDGERCVYAWQWLDRDDRRVVSALGGAASWRARICRKGESLDAIATALDAITIGARPELLAHAAPEPVAAPARVRTRPVASREPSPRLTSLDKAVPRPVIARPPPPSLTRLTRCRRRQGSATSRP